MSIFTPRKNFKPFEYDVTKFKEAIQFSYWTVHEFNFASDIQDYKVRLSPQEQAVVRKAVLAISQIEVAVKEFWGKIGDKFPKPEIKQVGATYSESEVRHADAYSHLLHVLGLDEEFESLNDNPVIAGRVDYLTKYIKAPASIESVEDRNRFVTTLAMFALFVENVSLFSQFYIVQSFNVKKNVLRSVDNVIQATRREEEIHALFGVWLINQIKAEHPEWFDAEFYAFIHKACMKAYEAEKEIVHWIFADGEPGFLTEAEVLEFLKHRFNSSLEMIGADKLFAPDLSKIKWYEEELMADVQVDFFHKNSVNYSRRQKSFTAGDLF